MRRKPRRVTRQSRDRSAFQQRSTNRAALRLGPCAAKCVETALLLKLVWDHLNDINDIGGSDTPLDEYDTIEDNVQQLIGSLMRAAGNAIIVADHNNAADRSDERSRHRN